MAAALTATEVAAFADLDEGRVRKDVEHGLFGRRSPPRFSVADIVYLRILSRLGLQLGVDDRAKLHDVVRKAMKAATTPATIELGPILDVKLGQVAKEVRDRLDRFEAWKSKLVTDENILGGEPVFPKSRVAVRQVGGVLLRGANVERVREDYPSLKDEDIEFSTIFARAYPRVGRPRERQAAAR